MKVKLNGNDFYEVSAPFGSIDYIHKTPHTGVDLVMNTGTHLFSPVDGVVKKVVDLGSENIGKGIYIETDNHQTVIMGHLSDFKVHEGQRVHEGDFVAYSGNTGRSTGSHLHLGLKDANGEFVDPKPLIQNESVETGGMIDNLKDFWGFMRDWREEGFWMAVYDKPFSQVIGDFLKELGHDILVFILNSGDLFFLLPAVVFFIGTWVVGRNKFTKWIVPLFGAYAITRVFYHMAL